MSEKTYVEQVLERARKAQKVVENFSQEQVDALVKAIGKAIYDNAEVLAKEAVEETHFGRVDSKIYKQQKACAGAWFYLKDKKSVGMIDNDTINGVVTFAKPMGVIACLTPSTNPTSTTGSNAMNAVKCRNAVVVSPHPSAKNVTKHGVELINEAIVKAGGPEDLVICLQELSMDNTKELMAKSDVVVATGGAPMVKSAYSSGRPSYGVGQGNVQCIVAPDYEDFDYLAKTLVASRSYDNGMPCTGEQALHLPKEKYDAIVSALEANKAVKLTKEAAEKLPGLLFKENGAINPAYVGMLPVKLAKEVGQDVPEDTQILIFDNLGMGDDNQLRREKLCPVIQLFPYDNFEKAVADAKANLLWEGAGHTSVVYTNEEKYAEYVGAELPLGRVVVNQAGGAASGGNFINGLEPTMSLGCGSWGNNSISENLTYRHLMNVTRLAYYHDTLLPDFTKVWDM